MPFTRDEIHVAMERRNRRDFLPRNAQHAASIDRPILIGHGQTNSQPRTVADMIELLELEEGHRVLDVGSGSGWSTAILADLVGETGSVTATELIPELADKARIVLAKQNLPWATIYDADLEVLGWPEGAPYDRILVSAQAQQLPESLIDQLAPSGLMVIPVATHMLRVAKTGGEPDISRHGRYSFVPLIEG